MTRLRWSRILAAVLGASLAIWWLSGDRSSEAQSAPLSRLARDAEYDGAAAAAGATISLHARVTASDHEIDRVDPQFFTLQDVHVRGIPQKPLTLLVRPGTDLSAFLTRVNGRRVVVTVWELPQ